MDTQNTRPEKPAKDWPLFPHRNGSWAKKIKGRLHYFGGWGDPNAALVKYQRQKPFLEAGLEPPPEPGLKPPQEPQDAPATVWEVVDSFLGAKQMKLKHGRLKAGSFDHYYMACERLLRHFGKNTPVEQVQPRHFTDYYKKLAEGDKDHIGFGLGTIGKWIQSTRSVFKHAFTEGLVDRPVRFGDTFAVPSRAEMRKVRNRRKPSEKCFTADEVRALIEAADTPVRAMVLLGINCGLGNTDCGELAFSHLDLDKGVIDFPRPKSGAQRRAVLWPETIKALRRAIEDRPAPRLDEHADLIFINRFQRPYIRYRPQRGDKKAGATIDNISPMFTKILKKLEIKRPGLAFYGLRHTFRTAADELPDRAAVDLVMGHTGDDRSMRSHYVHQIDDARIRVVADHTHRWLWPPKKRTRRRPRRGAG